MDGVCKITVTYQASKYIFKTATWRNVKRGQSRIPIKNGDKSRRAYGDDAKAELNRHSIWRAVHLIALKIKN